MRLRCDAWRACHCYSSRAVGSEGYGIAQFAATLGRRLATGELCSNRGGFAPRNLKIIPNDWF
jgi:hypothetical protein